MKKSNTVSYLGKKAFVILAFAIILMSGLWGVNLTQKQNNIAAFAADAVEYETAFCVNNGPWLGHEFALSFDYGGGYKQPIYDKFQSLEDLVATLKAACGPDTIIAIHFSADGTDGTLDIGESSFVFTDAFDGMDIYIDGNITSTNSLGTIRNNSTATLNIVNAIGGGTTVSAKISGYAIYNGGAGTVTVMDGGTVTATIGGDAIVNNGTGTVNVSGGKVTAGNGYAICNNSTGGVSISGGTVSASGASGFALYNNSTGEVNISDSGTVTATGNNGRAIYNGAGTVNVGGGEVSASGAIGYAVFNNSGDINVGGGTVSASGTSGFAVFNNSTGAVNVGGGTVEATGSDGAAIYNGGAGKMTVVQDDGKTTLVTSANVNSGQGTVYLAGGTASDTVLEILSGTIENTSATGKAIFNCGDGKIERAVTGFAGYTNLVYNGLDRGIAATLAGIVKINGVGDFAELSYKNSGNNTVTPKDAGNYTATVNPTINGVTYALTGATSQEFTIGKAPLTVMANNVSLPYGSTFVGNGVTYDGFVNGETASVLGGTLGYDTNYTTTTNAGTTGLTVTPKGLTSDNYEITVSNGTVTVTKLTYNTSGITFDNSTVTYDKDVTQFIVIDGNLPVGVTVKYYIDGAEFNGATAVGTYVITAKFTGDSDNCNLIDDMTATLVIKKATYNMSGITFDNLTVKVGNETHNIVIGGTLPTGVTVKYYVNGAEFSCATAVGTYVITAKFTGDSDNYNLIDDMTATLVIKKTGGLSGGAIAGIVISIIVVIGLGGFAIFWFVIKKKKFADLLAVFKKK